MKEPDFSTDELNKWIGRTKTPPDLLTLVDEHLRKTYKNVYAHPITPNDFVHWPERELGYIMIKSGKGVFATRLNIGTVHMDRVEMNLSSRNVATISSADPSFFQNLIKFIDNGEYIGGLTRRY